MPSRFDTTAYRYSNEIVILAITILLVLLVIGLTATATVCLSVVFIIGMLILAYFFSKSHHRELMAQAQQVTSESLPGLIPVLRESAARLQVERVEVYVINQRSLNAYTFGLESPKVIVLHAPLLQAMDRDELQFIIGHEMGHVKLGHTRLNSLVGGMAGIPSSFGAAMLLEIAFRWWNRACEYSADRAGLLAVGKPGKAISALVKLEAGVNGSHSQAGLEQALARIEAEDDDIGNVVGELLATHPLIVRRIEQIRKYAASLEYRNLQGRMNSNL